MLCFLPGVLRPTRAAHGSVPIAVQLGLEAAARGESIVLQVKGDCMEPFLRDGQQVAATPRVRVWPGDIVAVVGADGHLRVHRLLLALPRFAGGLCWTKPDAADWVDAPVHRDRSLGRVRRGAVGQRVRALALLARFGARSGWRRLNRALRASSS